NGSFGTGEYLLCAELRPISFVVASACYLVIGAVVGACLVSLTPVGVPGVFLGQLAGASAGLLVALVAARRSLRPDSFSKKALGTMLRYSVPLVLSSSAIFA